LPPPSGLFLAYIIDLGTHHLSSPASWRIPISLQLIWGVLLILGALALPESPRLLLGKGREQEAISAIARLNDAKVEDSVVAETMEELEDAIREENEGGKASWLECLSTRSASEWEPGAHASRSGERGPGSA
jgi:SP family sugar:H+ symporter-like MFS transporter